MRSSKLSTGCPTLLEKMRARSFRSLVPVVGVSFCAHERTELASRPQDCPRPLLLPSVAPKVYTRAWSCLATNTGGADCIFRKRVSKFCLGDPRWEVHVDEDVYAAVIYVLPRGAFQRRAQMPAADLKVKKLVAKILERLAIKVL